MSLVICRFVSDVINGQLMSVGSANRGEDEDGQVEKVSDPFYLCLFFYFLQPLNPGCGSHLLRYNIIRF